MLISRVGCLWWLDETLHTGKSGYGVVKPMSRSVLHCLCKEKGSRFHWPWMNLVDTHYWICLWYSQNNSQFHASGASRLLAPHHGASAVPPPNIPASMQMCSVSTMMIWIPPKTTIRTFLPFSCAWLGERSNWVGWRLPQGIGLKPNTCTDNSTAGCRRRLRDSGRRRPQQGVRVPLHVRRCHLQRVHQPGRECLTNTFTKSLVQQVFCWLYSESSIGVTA